MTTHPSNRPAAGKELRQKLTALYKQATELFRFIEQAPEGFTEIEWILAGNIMSQAQEALFDLDSLAKLLQSDLPEWEGTEQELARAYPGRQWGRTPGRRRRRKRPQRPGDPLR
jgi:hypothetical protein